MKEFYFYSQSKYTKEEILDFMEIKEDELINFKHVKNYLSYLFPVSRYKIFVNYKLKI